MFKAKKDEEETNTKTIIGSGISVEGILLKGEGNIKIDGEFKGEISISGNIIVGESGVIKGNVTADHALISGTVSGNIKTFSSVHLTDTASLEGDITASGLVIDEGAVFTGNCHMTNSSVGNETSYNEEDERDPNLSFDK